MFTPAAPARKTLTRLLSTLCLAAAASLASAQSAPAPPPPPPNVIDMGDIGIGVTKSTVSVPLVAGQNVWYKFRLTSPITPKTWLNIDTVRSLAPDGSALNVEIGMYNVWSYLVAWDDYSGGGTSLDKSYGAALTFGGGSGQRLGEDTTGWFGSRIDTGWNPEAGWRPYIGEGTFYVCIVGYNGDFSLSPNPNWQVPSNFTGTGTVRLRIRTGEVPATQHNEAFDGYDTGYSTSVAHSPHGAGPLTSILGSFNPGECDVYKIHICDPASFQVVATPTLQWGYLYGARMYLFDSTGRGVVGINNTINVTDTTLGIPPNVQISEGDYYLAVTSNCGGIDGYQAVPYDVNGQALWDFGNSSSWNKWLPPNGTGKTNPMYIPGRQGDCISNSNFYCVRLALSGVCYPQESCPADFDHSGFVDTDDFTAFINAFESGC